MRSAIARMIMITIIVAFVFCSMTGLELEESWDDFLIFIGHSNPPDPVKVDHVRHALSGPFYSVS